MPSRSQRFGQSSVKNVLKELDLLEGKLKEIPNSVLGEMAKECAQMAEKNFHNASYAGPQEHLNEISVKARKTEKGNWSVTATGDAVQWVEFGTGYEGDGTYGGNLPASYHYDEKRAGVPPHDDVKDFWRFSATDISRNGKDFAKHAKVRTGWANVKEVYDRSNEESDLGSFPVKEARAFLKAKKPKNSHYEVKDEMVETKSWTTQGNPANDCLLSAFQNTVENSADKLSEFMRK